MKRKKFTNSKIKLELSLIEYTPNLIVIRKLRIYRKKNFEKGHNSRTICQATNNLSCTPTCHRDHV